MISLGRAESAKTATMQKCHFYIIEYILLHQKLPMGYLPKRTLYRYVKKLILDGIIIKKGYGVYEANKQKVCAKTATKQVTKQPMGGHIRGHGFHWKVTIPKVRHWEDRKVFMDRFKISYKNSSSKAPYQSQRIIVDNHKVWLFDECIMIYCPKSKSFFADSAKDSRQMAINKLYAIIKSIEVLFKVRLSWANGYNVAVSKQHYAKVNDAMAKLANNEKSKIRCIYKGKEWFLIDKSLGLHESETVDRRTAHVDMDKIIVPLMNDYKQCFEQTGEIPLPSMMLKMMQEQNKMMAGMWISTAEPKTPDENDRPDYVG